MENEQLIDLNLLRPFVGDNKQMQQQLLLAFEKELLAFHEFTTDTTVNTNLDKVRVAYHRISPSLKMLQLKQLTGLLEDYKQELDAKETNTAVLKTQLLMIEGITNELLSEIKKWIISYR